MAPDNTNEIAALERKEKNEVVLTMKVSKEDFGKALMDSFKKNKNRFQIPGFRKGKVPYHMVKQYYGEGVLYDDAIDFCANPAYREAVKEHNLDVVSRPEMDVLEIGADKGMVFTVTVTEKPTVTLGEYKGVEAAYHYHPATDADVEEELNRLQDRNSRQIPVEDRPVQNGDTVTIDYEGFVDGVAFDGGKGENHDLVIGSGSFIPGFEEQLIGHDIGEEFAITVTFPEEYHSEDLKGKEASFQVKIHSIKKKELPELDDEFAKDVSDFDTLKEYKADLLKKKEEEAVNRAESAFKNNVLDVVCDKADVDIPECMVDTEVDNMVQNQASRMRYQGIELEQYLQYIGQTIEEFKEGMRSSALQQVKQNLVIETIMKKEKIEPTDEEVEKEMETMAKSYGMSLEDIKKSMGEDNSYIKENLAMQKTVDMLAENAKKTDSHEEKKKPKKPKKEKKEKAESKEDAE